MCSDPVNMCIWTFHSRSPGGLAHIRCYKPAPAPALVDNTDPTVPVLNVIQVIDKNNLGISWAVSSDPAGAGEISSGVKNYHLRRDGIEIGDSPFTHPQVSYTDTNRAPDTTYSYTIAAEDNAGNVSAYSAPRTGKTLPDTPIGDTVDLYVSAAMPNDNGNGTSQATAKRTIAAALALVQSGQTVGVMNGTYTAAIVSTRNGSAGSGVITLRALTGHSPIVSGTSAYTTRGGVQAFMHLEHEFLDFGEGIEFRGNNDGSTAKLGRLGA